MILKIIYSILDTETAKLGAKRMRHISLLVCFFFLFPTACNGVTLCINKWDAGADILEGPDANGTSGNSRTVIFVISINRLHDD